jgi:hypothetical protein
MNYKYTFPAALIALIGVSIALVQPQIAFALSSSEVAKMAKQITVLIDSKNPGSGVIVKRSGNTYTVLTASHNQPSHAKGHTFYCGKSKCIPVTFVRTQDSRIDFDQINSSSVTVKGDILSQTFSEPPKTTKQKSDQKYHV